MSIGDATSRTGPDTGGRKIDDHLVAGRLRVRQCLGQRVHGRTQDIDRIQLFQPVGRGVS